jgi:hypothetical protein
VESCNYRGSNYLQNTYIFKENKVVLVFSYKEGEEVGEGALSASHILAKGLRE